MATRIQLRRDLASSWTTYNPTLFSGEIGLETDTGKLKIGDGLTAWTSLAYSSGVQGQTGIQGALGTQGTQGLQGIQGTTGIQGNLGTQGIQGTAGPSQLYLDGGLPDSTYGGVTAVDGGTA